MATKLVKFYRPIYVHQDGSREEPDDSFWGDAHALIEGLDPKNRGVNYRGASLFGEAGVGRARAYPYIRVGRVRYRAEWPETVDPAGVVGDLNLDGRNIFEAGYVVPFGTSTRVAIMGPIRGLVTTQAIEWWLSQVLGLAATDMSLELVPEVDPALARKLNESLGVSRLSVRMPKGTVVEMDTDSRIEAAFAAANEAQDDQLHVDLKFSFGHQTPTANTAGMLKRAAQKIADSGAAERVDVGLMVPDAEGFKIESHELLKDNITVTVDFDVEDDTRLSTDDVLDAVHDAIHKFRNR